MSARNTVVRTTCAKTRPAGFEQRADVLEDAARLGARCRPSTSCAGRGIERHLAGDEQQLAGAKGRRVGPDRLRRVGARDGDFTHRQAALTTLFERRHRVQTRIRLMPPLIIARTVCRFGSNRRGLTLCAWLSAGRRPGPFRRFHTLAIDSPLELEAVTIDPEA